MGPLNGLLQAVRDVGPTGPVVSRIAIDEAELVGTDGESLPEPWPADADAPPAFDPRMRADALRGVDAMISGLERLSQDLAKPVEVAPEMIAGAVGDRVLPRFQQHLRQCGVCREEYEILCDLARLEAEGNLPRLPA